MLICGVVWNSPVGSGTVVVPCKYRCIVHTYIHVLVIGAIAKSRIVTTLNKNYNTPTIPINRICPIEHINIIYCCTSLLLYHVYHIQHDITYLQIGQALDTFNHSLMQSV